MIKTYSTSEQPNTAAKDCGCSAIAAEQGSASGDDFWTHLDDIADIESLNEPVGDMLQDTALDGADTAEMLSAYSTSLETYDVESRGEWTDLSHRELYKLGLSVVEKRRAAATTNDQMSIAPVAHAEDAFSRSWRPGPNWWPNSGSVLPQIRPELGDLVLLHFMAQDTGKGPDFLGGQVCEPLVESTPDRGKEEGETTKMANEERWTQQFLQSLIQLEDNPATYRSWVEKVTSQHLEANLESIRRSETPLLKLSLREPRPLDVGEDCIAEESHEEAQLLNPALMVVLDRAIAESEVFDYDSMWLFPKEVQGLANSLTHQWEAGTDMMTTFNARKVLCKAVSEIVSFSPATYTHETVCDQHDSEVIDMPERTLSIPSGLSLEIRPHTNWTPEYNQHFKMPKEWELLYRELEPKYNEWLAKDVADEGPVSDPSESKSIRNSTPASDTGRVRIRRRTPPHEDDDAERSAQAKRVRTHSGEE